jgi:hypothetical protein
VVKKRQAIHRSKRDRQYTGQKEKGNTLVKKRDRQYTGQKETGNTLVKERQAIHWSKRKTMIYKTLPRKLRIEQHEPH